MRYKIETIKISLEVKEGETLKTDSPGETVNILRAIYKDLDADQEHFSILILDNKNNIIGEKVLFTGGVNRSTLDLKVIFRTALLMGAVNIIVCHNHPSGDPMPSVEDITATNCIKEGAYTLGLKLLDHIILGSEKEFYSFNYNKLV